MYFLLEAKIGANVNVYPGMTQSCASIETHYQKGISCSQTCITRWAWWRKGESLKNTVFYVELIGT